MQQNWAGAKAPARSSLPRKATRAAAATVAAALMACALAVPANATLVGILAGSNLSANYAYASGTSAYGVNYVWTSSDHTACPALAQGFGGLKWDPRAQGYNMAYPAGDCGPGQTNWYPTGTSGITFHGTVYNPNVSTTDYIYNSAFAY